jgi:hypothetical protein
MYSVIGRKVRQEGKMKPGVGAPCPKLWKVGTCAFLVSFCALFSPAYSQVIICWKQAYEKGTKCKNSDPCQRLLKSCVPWKKNYCGNYFEYADVPVCGQACTGESGKEDCKTVPGTVKCADVYECECDWIPWPRWPFFKYVCSMKDGLPDDEVRVSPEMPDGPACTG